MAQFLKTSLPFLLGLVLTILAVDRLFGMRLAMHHGRGQIGPEVYVSIEKSRQTDGAVRTVYLGDSVAHQMFRPGTEARNDLRFLPCNQAISMAGQFYLLEEALNHFPNVREVCLIYFPHSLENDLGPPLTATYFCGYFHSFEQVCEVFRLKHDFHLTLIHLGRWLLPNLMATNDAWRPSVSRPDSSTATAAPAINSDEPLLRLIAALFPAPTRSQETPHLNTEVFLSPTSDYFVHRMRELCRARNVELRVLPCPCSDQQPLVDPNHIFDAGVIFADQSWFRDQIHPRRQYIAVLRERVEREYGLPTDSVRE